jgi:hypothetical protein
MEYLPRPIESCAFRDDVRGDAGLETARCGVLAELLAGGVPELFRVGRDACLACCQSRPPRGAEINPVIASLLYDRVATPVPGAVDARRKADVLSVAEQYLEAEIPREEATPPWPRRALVDCGYLGAPISESRRVFACHHPAHVTTTDDECRRCRDWSEVPGPAPPPLAQLVPGPTVRHGPRIGKWAVGVTTAPRRQETLTWCLDSLARAGWSAPRLFIDGPVVLAERFSHLAVTLRAPAVGAWPNYYLSLAELLMREPQADAYLIVQDDTIFYDREDLRLYLESALWPDERIGAVSLYCPMTYTQSEHGWHRRAGAWVYGALAFAFPRASSKRFVADISVLEHRWSERNEGRAQIDVVIGAWAERSTLPIYYPTPSLVQHIGDTSTLWARARALGARKADRFAGDLA